MQPHSATDTLKVFATHTQLTNNLKRIKVELVDDPYKADVVWMREHFHDFKYVSD